VIGVKPKPGSGFALPTVKITTATSTPTSHPEASVAGEANWTVTGAVPRHCPQAPTARAAPDRHDAYCGGWLKQTTGWYAKSKDHGIASPGTVKVYVISVKFY